MNHANKEESLEWVKEYLCQKGLSNASGTTTTFKRFNEVYKLHFSIRDGISFFDKPMDDFPYHKFMFEVPSSKEQFKFLLKLLDT